MIQPMLTLISEQEQKNIKISGYMKMLRAVLYTTGIVLALTVAPVNTVWEFIYRALLSWLYVVYYISTNFSIVIGISFGLLGLSFSIMLEYITIILRQNDKFLGSLTENIYQDSEANFFRLLMAMGKGDNNTSDIDFGLNNEEPEEPKETKKVKKVKKEKVLN
ncbi:MAG: hypothetical protein EHM87_22380 [Burkholderiales bacterium]|nr:MAG: hypothetical protein EHM87_22380 [Burkholderiales bacterium]